MGKFVFGRKFAAGIMSLSLAITSIALVSSDAVGTDYDSLIEQKEAEIEQKQKEIDSNQKKIDQYEGDISENEEIMATISSQIDSVTSQVIAKQDLIAIKEGMIELKEADIEKVEEDIAAKEEEINQKKLEINELNAQNDKNLEKFSRLARVLYMNDSSDAIPLLSGSDDWYNFFVYSDVIKNISGQNMEFMQTLLANIKSQEEMIEELNGKIKQLENDKLKLEQEKAALEEERAGLEGEKEELEAEMTAQYNNFYAVSADNADLQKKVDNLNYAINVTEEEIEQTNKDIEALIRQKQAENSGQTIYSSDGFRWPLDSRYQMITTYFGRDYLNGKARTHYGIDVGNAGIGGANIYAAQSGTVITAYNDGPNAWHGGYGNYIVIDHGGGISTLYAHCSVVTVTEGQVVNKGDVIGYVGTTGYSTGNHLHFEVRVDGTATDPFGYAYEYV